MKAGIRVLLATSAGFAMTAAGEAAADCTLNDLRWLAGTWRACDDGQCTEETWLPATGTRMLAVNRQWGKHEDFEFLRIEQQDGALVYLAQPRGRPPTPFRVESCAGSTVVFGNPAHDFPQRIIYETAGDELEVRIEGGSGETARSMRWRWRRGDPARETE